MNIIPLRVALAQVNVTVGDLEGNTQKVLTSMQWLRVKANPILSHCSYDLRLCCFVQCR